MDSLFQVGGNSKGCPSRKIHLRSERKEPDWKWVREIGHPKLASSASYLATYDAWNWGNKGVGEPRCPYGRGFLVWRFAGVLRGMSSGMKTQFAVEVPKGRAAMRLLMGGLFVVADGANWYLACCEHGYCSLEKAGEGRGGLSFFHNTATREHTRCEALARKMPDKPCLRFGLVLLASCLDWKSEKPWEGRGVCCELLANHLEWGVSAISVGAWAGTPRLAAPTLILP